MLTNKKHKKGFTLVELLIVIIVLVTLIIVGVVIFRSTRININNTKKIHDHFQVGKGLTVDHSLTEEYSEDESVSFEPGVLVSDGVVNQKLPHSGQKMCWANPSPVECGNLDFPNQDGDNYRPLEHVDNGNNTVSDKLTGLMWQKGDETRLVNWQEALNYCDKLSLAGYRDWRLPNIKELVNIMDYKHNQFNPMVDLIFDSSPHVYLSSTSYLNDPSVIYAANPTLNDLSSRKKNKGHSAGHVVCVRGESNLPHTGVLTCYDNLFPIECGNSDFPNQDGDNYRPPEYIDNKDYTVTDKLTGLMWQKGDIAEKMDWQEALNYCDKLSLVGYRDWRLPNIKELVSIVDYNQFNPTADSILSMNSGSYWSATSFGSRSAYAAWGVSFYGFVESSLNTSFKKGEFHHNYTTCVRKL